MTGGRPFTLVSRRQAEQRLETLARRSDELHVYGDSVVQEFHARFPDVPAYLTYYSDRTSTDYRWRRSSAKRWRGEGQRVGVNRTFDLTSEDGLLLVQWLPVEVREVWLGYERERIEINRELALVAYERRRLREHLRRLEILRRFARNAADNSE